MTRSDRWKQRPAVMRYWDFCDKLRGAWGGIELSPCLALVFYISMPPSWSAKKKSLMIGKPHQSKPDVDNYIKAFLDALCVDDSYIYSVKGTKYWSDTGRIEVAQFEDAKDVC
jgi:hypothetical protein